MVYRFANNVPTDEPTVPCGVTNRFPAFKRELYVDGYTFTAESSQIRVRRGKAIQSPRNYLATESGFRESETFVHVRIFGQLRISYNPTRPIRTSILRRSSENDGNRFSK